MDCTGLAPLAVEDVCGAMAAALCDGFAACGLLGPAQHADCEAQAFGGCDVSRIAASANATYDGAAAACCIATIAADDCSGGPEQFGRALNAAAACESAFVGSVLDGGSCVDDEECSAASFCNADAQCPGTCTVRGSAGAACEDEGGCLADHFCDSSTGPGVCAAFGTAGALCNRTGECAAGLFCLDDGADTDRCTEPPHLGEACDTSTFICDWKSFCEFDFVAQTGSCTAKLSQGGACIFPFACEAGLYCAGADTSVYPFVMGSCEPASLLGEACDPATASNSLQCGALFACDEATSSCFAGLAELADCSQGTSCSSGLVCTSDAQLCEQPRAGGAACGSAGDCASGRCVGAVCDAVTACDG